MKVVGQGALRQQQAAATVTQIRPQGMSGVTAGQPDTVITQLVAKITELEKKLGQVVAAHNATVQDLTKLKAAHNTVARGASSLAKHFQGFTAAAQIQYTPAVVARNPPPAQAQAVAPRAAPQGRPAAAPPPSQQVVEVEPQNGWERREAAFYEGGEGEEG